ncbi:hypothetical protein TUM4630_10540 [Shewanella algidipiscicola]|uniref:Uncharacterized protein n=1 Tax=Shewanella algidipiscicola TaxID=614070 RepID=A0ABQ4PAN3_9GAMM|nr:hypothetical protein TUM4630_10540 [Shewanella algidipiscicola]
MQEIKPDIESLGSKNNILPSSTLSGLVITAGFIGSIGSPAEAADMDNKEASIMATGVNLIMKIHLSFVWLNGRHNRVSITAS